MENRTTSAALGLFAGLALPPSERPDEERDEGEIERKAIENISTFSEVRPLRYLGVYERRR